VRRSAKLGLGLLGAILALVAIAIVIVATFNWNRAKPWFAATVSDAAARRVTIDGDLVMRWRRDTDLEGWRSWVPTPHLTAGKITVANTDWGKAGEFLTADSVDLDIALLPLLAHRISVHAVRFVAPNVHLERIADGRDNWDFNAPERTPWTLDVGSVVLDQGEFTLADEVNAVDVAGKVEMLGASAPFEDTVTEQVRQARHEVLKRIGTTATKRFEERADRRAEQGGAPRRSRQQYAFAWSAHGKYHKEAFTGTGKLGGVFFLRNPETPFPLLADTRVGDTHIAFVGTLTDPTNPDALDLRLWLAGSNLSKLYDIAALPMPNSPPYAMEGRLVGRLTSGARKLRYERFTARIGDSDMSGDLNYEGRAPRPLLSGKVISEELQFRDLAPLIGADSGPAKHDADGKLIPETPFRPERWRVMDADVEFTGDHVFRDSELPIHKVDTRIRMDDGVLSLDPWKFRYSWGDVDARLSLDGRQAPIKAALDLTARDMQLKHLFPGASPDQIALGRADGDAKLEASGNSVGALLGAANGELRVMLDGGTISKGLLETAGLNMPNIVVARMFGDKPVKIDCAAADLVADNGVFDARTFLIDTDASLIDVTGTIDLRNERVDLVVHPNSKGVRLLSLHSPLHVKGPFEKIDVSVDKAALLARAAGAIGLATVAAPAAALLPLTSANVTGQDANRCAALVEEMPKRPASKAPPAPKKKTQ
jgi:uncharacterized protein involved in outer membrane biogenesis